MEIYTVSSSVPLNDVKERLTCSSHIRQQRLCGRKTQADLLRRSGLLRDVRCDEGKFMKGVEDKLVDSFLIFSSFVLHTQARPPFVFSVILNTLLLVITSRKQTIDHLHIY